MSVPTMFSLMKVWEVVTLPGVQLGTVCWELRSRKSSWRVGFVWSHSNAAQAEK